MAFFLSKKSERASSVIHHPLEYTYAGFEARLYACAIDMLLLGIVSLLFHIFSLGLLFLFIQAVYFIGFWHFSAGKTIGNSLMGIQVRSLQGERITILQGTIRFIGLLVSLITLIGGAWMFFNKKKQGFHDKIAHTIVIKTR